MRFQTPQFIDVEDQVFGSLSWRQFVYIIGGVGIAYLLYQVLPTIIAIVLILPVLGLAAALAFYNLNGRPFIHTLEAAFGFFSKNKLYLWKKTEKKKAPQESQQIKQANEALFNPINVPHLSESKLKEFSWSIEVEQDITKINP